MSVTFQSNRHKTLRLPPAMKPALSQVCTLESSFSSDVADYAASGSTALEVWLTKLETYLQSHSIGEVHRLLDEHGVTTPVASYQGGLLSGPREKRDAAWELFERRLELCREFGVQTIVVAGDISGPLSESSLQTAGDELRRAAEMAAKRGVRVALEFRADAAFANNLQTAAAWLDELGEANLGLCLDAFHFYTGPSKTEDLALLTADSLFHVQLCDLADTPRELAADAHRILPGDGDLPLESIVQALEAIDFVGHVSIELMNPQIWRIPPRQFGEVGMSALRSVLGLEIE